MSGWADAAPAAAGRNRLARAGAALHTRLFAPVDAASLAAFRVAFGAIMLIAILRYFRHGWIETFFVEPRWFFPYEGLAWLRPWPAPGMTLHFAALGILAAAVLVGFRARASVLVFGAGFTWAHLVDKTNYLNHYYLVSLLCVLLACCPIGAAASLDAWRRPTARRSTVPAWTVGILRAQLAVVYVFGGLAKLNPDWMLHAQPLRFWLAGRVDLPVLGPLLDEPWVAYAFSWGGAVFDLGIVPALLWHRSRPFAYAAVLGFHLATSALFPIGIFPWLMIAATPIFFAPAWPRTAWAWWRHWTAGTPRAVTRTAAERPGALAAPSPRWSGHERLLAAALAAWIAVQVLVPLRGLAYAGNGYWTEHGFRFAWKVMVMEKRGEASFRVTDRASRATSIVDPASRLTSFQAHMMATQPDMIRQFARMLADEARANGRDVEVRADAFASLNGRPSRRLIDPAVDLAAPAPPPYVSPLE